MSLHPASARDILMLTVLGLLIEGPLHPYDMQRIMRERHREYAIGQLRGFYDAVDRLVQGGLIESVEVTREGKRPERTIYRITEQGQEHFTAQLSEWLEHPAREFPLFTIAISLLGYFPREEAVKKLHRRAVFLEGDIASLEVIQQALLTKYRLPRMVLLENEYTITLKKAELSWLYALIKDLQSGAFPWREEIDWGLATWQPEEPIGIEGGN